MMSERERLQQAIRDLHGCGSSYLRSERVHETFNDRTVRDGIVEIFSLSGHARAGIAYAWVNDRGAGETRYLAVLRVPPVQSAADAVRASIEAERRTEGSRDVVAAIKSTLQVKTGDDGDVWARWIDESAPPVPQVASGTMTAAPGQNCAHCDARNRTWKDVPVKDLPAPDRMPRGELVYECKACGKTTREGRYKKVAGGGRFGFGPKAPPPDSSY